MNQQPIQPNPRNQQRVNYKPKTVVDYVNIVRRYWVTAAIIFSVIFGLAAIYAFTASNIYKAETTLKIIAARRKYFRRTVTGRIIRKRKSDRPLYCQ